MGTDWKWLPAAALSLALVACGGGTPDPLAGDSGAGDSGATLSAQVLEVPPTLRELSAAGSTSLQAGAPDGGALQNPELRGRKLLGAPPAPVLGAQALSGLDFDFNRRLPQTRPGKGVAPRGLGALKLTPQPALQRSFDGLNHRDTRTANGGRQFSNEPPDQGLCVGNGFVLETVNSVLRVFGTDGAPRTIPVDLNTFNGYPAAIIRGPAPVFGPTTFDPSCHYDAASGRWFHLTDVLGTNPATGALTGKNSLDLAVSRTGDPTGAWTIYRLAAHNDGTDGTPAHRDCPCFGDYPHLGVDEHGVYITTNEFSLVTGDFNGTQIYALPKAQLVAGAGTLNIVSYDLAASPIPAFTLMPSRSPDGEFDRGTRGTEHFVSSLAVFEDSGASDRLVVWALTNTSSLNAGRPALTLNASVIRVQPYAVPPAATQKAGNFPLGQCINDTTLPTPLGPGCWRNLLATEPPHTEVLSPLDGGDSRVQQVMYADGKLWTTLGTAVNDAGTDRVGAAWFVLRPQTNKNKADAVVVNQGVLSVPGNNVLFPAVAVTSAGRGAVGVTLVGPDHHPSAAYFGISKDGVSPLAIAAAGRGTQDGFSGYRAFGDPPRPRWGDYAAAASDGASIWLANEYIAADCTLAQYAAAPFGSCGGTRTTLANWATRITQVIPGK
ncbi:hypothetical protein [Deinococcus koreensis]|uniref:Uncharacterized protein n=1 Tax=Deinococcus koreensis TaxID=2054903 RepID=A0A2K3UW45_9DEIO|nr:hypothetical protein [Deinococcus koreensis]PNY80757.1 hypothetical protein CVO96_04690 [Deinococcus koreensis]